MNTMQAVSVAATITAIVVLLGTTGYADKIERQCETAKIEMSAIVGCIQMPGCFFNAETAIIYRTHKAYVESHDCKEN